MTSERWRQIKSLLHSAVSSLWMAENQLLLEHEPACQGFVTEVRRFLETDKFEVQPTVRRIGIP